MKIIANVTLWLTSPGSIAGSLAPFREMRQLSSPIEDEKGEGPERVGEIEPTREQDKVK